MARRSTKPRWFSAWERADLGALRDAVASDFTLHFSDDLIAHVPEGAAGLELVAASLKAAFPDLGWRILQRSGQGHTEVLTCAARGHHRGPFIRVRPTGRRVSFPARFMTRSQDGAIVERWIRLALASILPQLGMAPEAPR